MEASRTFEYAWKNLIGTVVTVTVRSEFESSVGDGVREYSGRLKSLDAASGIHLAYVRAAGVEGAAPKEVTIPLAAMLKLVATGVKDTLKPKAASEGFGTDTDIAQGAQYSTTRRLQHADPHWGSKVSLPTGSPGGLRGVDQRSENARLGVDFSYHEAQYNSVVDVATLTPQQRAHIERTAQAIERGGAGAGRRELDDDEGDPALSEEQRFSSVSRTQEPVLTRAGAPASTSAATASGNGVSYVPPHKRQSITASTDASADTSSPADSTPAPAPAPVPTPAPAVSPASTPASSATTPAPSATVTATAPAPAPAPAKSGGSLAERLKLLNKSVDSIKPFTPSSMSAPAPAPAPTPAQPPMPASPYEAGAGVAAPMVGGWAPMMAAGMPGSAPFSPDRQQPPTPYTAYAAHVGMPPGMMHAGYVSAPQPGGAWPSPGSGPMMTMVHDGSGGMMSPSATGMMSFPVEGGVAYASMPFMQRPGAPGMMAPAGFPGYVHDGMHHAGGVPPGFMTAPLGFRPEHAVAHVPGPMGFPPQAMYMPQAGMIPGVQFAPMGMTPPPAHAQGVPTTSRSTPRRTPLSGPTQVAPGHAMTALTLDASAVESNSAAPAPTSASAASSAPAKQADRRPSAAPVPTVPAPAPAPAAKPSSTSVPAPAAPTHAASAAPSSGIQIHQPADVSGQVQASSKPVPAAATSSAAGARTGSSGAPVSAPAPTGPLSYSLVTSKTNSASAPTDAAARTAAKPAAAAAPAAPVAPTPAPAPAPAPTTFAARAAANAPRDGARRQGGVSR